MTTVQAAAPPALAEVYRQFESLGNNCEFGIVQRRAGCDAPGLFRNVGFLDVEQIIRAISVKFDHMFEPGRYDFSLPEGWPDWRLNCNVFGFGFHSTIPSNIKIGTREWVEYEQKIVRSFIYLKLRLLEDLEAGRKIFVFRTLQQISDEQIRRLHAAIRTHGDGALLFVRVGAAGSLEVWQSGLFVGMVARLSDENPPIIDFAVWESLARRSLALASDPAIAAKDVESAAGSWPPAPPHAPAAAVITHHVRAAAGKPTPIYALDCEGLRENTFITMSGWIYLPEDFPGVDVNLVMHGYRSEAFTAADIVKTGRWQRISVTACVPPGMTRAVPTLSVVTSAGCTIHTAGWVLRHHEGNIANDRSAAAAS